MGTGRRVAVIFWHRERVLCVETDGWYTNLVCCGAMPNLPAALHLTTWLCWERKSSGLVLLKESNCSTATIWSQQTTKCVYAQWACLIFEPLDSALLCMCVPPEEKKNLGDTSICFALRQHSRLLISSFSSKRKQACRFEQYALSRNKKRRGVQVYQLGKISDMSLRLASFVPRIVPCSNIVLFFGGHFFSLKTNWFIINFLGMRCNVIELEYSNSNSTDWSY